ncbi:MAG: hypothetical protein KF886_26845 [Candidatus Hydrogenedentes bacterium]|nr:hypothetical protein [Candidatus Hydrogenedentota bacterium]
MLRIIRFSPHLIAVFLTGCLLLVVMPAVAEPPQDAVDPRSAPPLETFQADMERRLAEENERLEARLEEMRRVWAAEQERLRREFAQLQEESEKAYRDINARAQRFFEENEGEIHRGMRELHHSLGVLGDSMLGQFRAWSEQAGGEGARDADAMPSLSVTFYVLAAGLPGEAGAPLPERLADLRAELEAAGQGGSLVLLDQLRVQTPPGAPVAAMSHLTDARPGTAQPYTVELDGLEPEGAGRLRFQNLRFRASIDTDGFARKLEIQASPVLAMGRPALIGTTSFGGAGQALLLVAEVGAAE